MIGLAFRGGQRMADVIQLRKEDILLLPHRVLITFRRGKVVPRIGPFTISLPTNLGQTKCAVLARLREMLNTTASGFILTHGNTEAERAQVSGEVTKRLKDIDPSLEARSIRRGGLSRLAAAGASETALLLYSRHASTSMLYRYLNAGQLMVAHHVIQDAAQTQAAQIRDVTQRSS
jgi:integrase